MYLKKLALLSTLFAFCASCLAADNPVQIDNDFVRIVKVADAPHNKSALHRHPFNRVMVYLDTGDITIDHEDGHKDEQHWRAGQVAWSPAGGMHTSENVGSAPIRIVEIELKKPAPAAAPLRNPELDPLAIDSAHYSLLFENDQVRVFRSWREPGGAEPTHEHTGRGRATVLLTELDAKVKLADGSTIVQHGAPGDVTWSDGPVIHSSTNTGSNRLEVIVVEVK